MKATTYVFSPLFALLFAINTVSSSSSGNREAWTSKIYFAPQADIQNPSIRTYNDGELRTELANIIDVDEDILNVSIWKCNLFSWQLTNVFVFHAYVVFETDKFWWSVEKNNEGITIQRAKNSGSVKYWYRNTLRKSTSEIITDRGRRTMKNLIDFIYIQDELNKEYSFTSSNCKHFAKKLFDEVGVLVPDNNFICCTILGSHE